MRVRSIMGGVERHRNKRVLFPERHESLSILRRGQLVRIKVSEDNVSTITMHVVTESRKEIGIPSEGSVRWPVEYCYKDGITIIQRGFRQYILRIVVFLNPLRYGETNMFY